MSISTFFCSRNKQKNWHPLAVDKIKVWVFFWNCCHCIIHVQKLWNDDDNAHTYSCYLLILYAHVQWLQQEITGASPDLWDVNDDRWWGTAYPDGNKWNRSADVCRDNYFELKNCWCWLLMHFLNQDRHDQNKRNKENATVSPFPETSRGAKPQWQTCWQLKKKEIYIFCSFTMAG